MARLKQIVYYKCGADLRLHAVELFRGGISAGDAGAGGVFERADESRNVGGGLVGVCRLFNLGDDGGADDGSVGDAAENGNVLGLRNAEADGKRKSGEAADAAGEREQIFGKRIARAGDARARDEIEEAAGTFGDFGEAPVGGSGRGKKDRVEMASAHGGAILGGLFGSQIGDKD